MPWTKLLILLCINLMATAVRGEEVLDGEHTTNRCKKNGTTTFTFVPHDIYFSFRPVLRTTVFPLVYGVVSNKRKGWVRMVS